MEEKHPIEGIMTTTLESIRDMIDVDTVVGEPISTAEGATIIPVSRVSFGFVAGGGEYGSRETPRQADEGARGLPFAGGTGAGVTVQPIGFLVTSRESVRLLPAQCASTLDRVIELIPQAMADLRGALSGGQPGAAR